MTAVEFAIQFYVTIDDGNFVELGVATGGSLRQIVNAACRRQIERNDASIGTPRRRGVYGFDSFYGLPSDWKPDLPKGSFNMNGQKPTVPGATIVAGMFEDTLPEFARHLEAQDEVISFLHVDCDLYESALCGLTELNQFIREGTIIVFDEFYNHGGAEMHEQLALADWVKRFGRSYKMLPTGDNSIDNPFRATIEVTK